MTIPIRPGPFSFLAGLGEAGGKAVESAEKERQRKFKEAQDRVNMLLTLQHEGLIQSDQWNKPEMAAVYKTLGIPAVSGGPTSSEMKENITRRLLARQETKGFRFPTPGLIPGTAETIVQPTGENVPTDQRMFVGYPSRSAIQREEELQPKQIAAEGAQAELTGAQATAALPGAAATVVAGQQGELDKQYNDVAWRHVTGLYAENKGGLPTPEEALRAASKDTNAVGVTRAHMGEAVTKLRLLLKDQYIKELMANARFMGASGTGLDDLARINTNMMGIYAQMLRDTRSRMGVQDNDRQLAQMAANQRQMGLPVSAPIMQAEERWNNYVDEAGRILNDINSLGQKTAAVVAPAMGVPAPSPTAGGEAATAKGQARQEYNARVRGITNPARRRAIAQEIATKYGVPLENR